MTFLEWIKQIPTLYKLLSAGLVAVLGLFAPDRLIPEPLDPFRTLVSLIVVVAFALTWAWRDELQRQLRWVTSGVFVLLIVLSIMNVLFVRQVEYTNPDGEVGVEQVLVGVNSDLRGMPDEEVIMNYGVGWGSLKQAYGTSFVLVALSYAILYLMLSTGIILALGGSQLAQPQSTAPS